MRLAGPELGDAIGGSGEVAGLAPQPTPLPKGVWKELRLWGGPGWGDRECCTQAPAWLRKGRVPLGHWVTPEVPRGGRVPEKQAEGDTWCPRGAALGLAGKPVGNLWAGARTRAASASSYSAALAVARCRPGRGRGGLERGRGSARGGWWLEVAGFPNRANIPAERQQATGSRANTGLGEADISAFLSDSRLLSRLLQSTKHS